MSKPLNRSRMLALSERADALTRFYPPGTPCRYWRGVREGGGTVGTISNPWAVTSSGDIVVWVAGEEECIEESHIEAGTILRTEPLTRACGHAEEFEFRHGDPYERQRVEKFQRQPCLACQEERMRQLEGARHQVPGGLPALTYAEIVDMPPRSVDRLLHLYVFGRPSGSVPGSYARSWRGLFCLFHYWETLGVRFKCGFDPAEDDWFCSFKKDDGFWCGCRGKALSQAAARCMLAWFFKAYPPGVSP